MPKKRKQPGTRKIEKRILIACEGKKDKSEYAYLDKFIKSCKLQSNKVEIKLIDIKKNTGLELVKELIKTRHMENDILWIVYDKNGYTKHAETFSYAGQKNVNISFSSIAFEMWILLHYEQTSRAFTKSDDIIEYINKKKYLEYEKADINIFLKTKDFINTAIKNAKWLLEYQNNSKGNNTNIYDLNPYTDIYKLLLQIIENESK